LLSDSPAQFEGQVLSLVWCLQKKAAWGVLYNRVQTLPEGVLLKGANS
jgi:hypothetical protein